VLLSAGEMGGYLPSCEGAAAAGGVGGALGLHTRAPGFLRAGVRDCSNGGDGLYSNTRTPISFWIRRNQHISGEYRSGHDPLIDWGSLTEACGRASESEIKEGGDFLQRTRTSART